MVKEVYAYLQSHWDREWYKTFEEYRIRLCDVLDDIFQKLEDGEINSFYLDGQTAALDDYLEIFPNKKDYVKTLIQKKKLFAGPFYTLSDEFLVNGESLIRNLLIGINKSKDYDVDCKDLIGYLPDAFGHSGWMPMLLKKTNIDKALVWRGLNGKNQEFSWASPNGVSIKTLFLAGGYYQDFFAQKTYKQNITKLLDKLNQVSDDNMPLILPIGADHLACEDNIKAKIKNFNRNNDKYKIKLLSLKEYFEKTASNKNLKTVIGELRENDNSYLLPSVASSRIYLKQKNMQIQWQLQKIIEPLYALLTSKNLIKSKKENIDYVWKLLLQNHAHDSICGCALDAVHSENMMRYEKIEQILNTLIDNAKFKLSDKISNKEIGIFNLSNFDYSGVCKFYSDKKLPLISTGKKKAFPIEISQDIHNIPVQENYHYYYEYLLKVSDMKGLSFNIIKPEKHKNTSLKLEGNKLENEFIEVTINNNGTINIKNKITGKVFSNIFNITDEADVGDSYNFSFIPNDKKLFAQFKGAWVAEYNDLRKIVKMVYDLNIPSHAKDDSHRSKKLIKHTFDVELILCEGSKKLDIKINYENLSKDHILKLNFTMPNSITSVISEDTYGTIKRTFDPNYDYKKLIPLPKYKEVDLNTGVFQRFVNTQGLCILTKGLQEYEVDKNNLNITLLRSFGIIAKKSLLTRTAAAGPPLPTPEGQCLGKHVAEISLLITDNTTEMFKAADEFYNPLVIIDGIAKNTELNSFDFAQLSHNTYLYNLKEAEDKSGIIAKIFNYSYSSENINFSNVSNIYETNLLEENISNENLTNKAININSGELKILKIYSY